MYRLCQLMKGLSLLDCRFQFCEAIMLYGVIFGGRDSCDISMSLMFHVTRKAD